MSHPEPALSIVLVVVGDDAAAIAESVQLLESQRSEVQGELVVPADEFVRDVLDASSLPRGWRMIPVNVRRATPPVLRAAGVAAATGRVIALSEEHAVPDPAWARAVLAAHAATDDVVGGVIDKRLPESRTGWAAYLLDYGRYVPGTPGGTVHSLTACNVSYKRDVLRSVHDVWDGSFRETAVHDALRARGVSLRLEPAMIVRQRRRVSLRTAMREFLAYGLEYGADRRMRDGALIGARRALTSPLLPMVFAVRARRALMRFRGARPSFPTLLFSTMALGLAWAIGEAVGSLQPPKQARRPE